jgi:hypothetical protein
VTPIHHHDPGIGVVDQRIDEAHSSGARSNDQIVGSKHGHDYRACRAHSSHESEESSMSMENV